ncbi:hypothetical protein [Candidatus Borrarchaeum sp.]|uniref:hypothetical protein n=1 Tax=Candidatus Borrarchaeum sp. TaxID=2846742 RepID=UPI00257F8A8D|nr:hypothetical protein [Candidatus Borrarchaeum sp.]
MYVVRFKDKSLEKRVYDYIQENSEVEIFLGLIGFLRGSGTKDIEYMINDVIPFPNLSLRPQETVIVPQVWYETLTMYIRLKFRKANSIHRPLGCLHSHPGEIPLPTPHDKNFAKALAKDAGNALMVIVGNNNLMYAYRAATDNDMEKIRVHSNYFRVRTRPKKNRL